MPHSRRGPRHHCPGAYGKVDRYPGNCRHNGVWCETHENYCVKHDWSYMKKWNCPACEKEERFNELRKDKEPDDDEERKEGKKKEKGHKQIAKAARQDKQAGVKKPKKKDKSKDGSKDGCEDSEEDGDTEDYDCFDSESVNAVPSAGNHVDAVEAESGMEAMAEKEFNRSTNLGEFARTSPGHLRNRNSLLEVVFVLKARGFRVGIWGTIIPLFISISRFIWLSSTIVSLLSLSKIWRLHMFARRYCLSFTLGVTLGVGFDQSVEKVLTV